MRKPVQSLEPVSPFHQISRNTATDLSPLLQPVCSLHYCSFKQHRAHVIEMEMKFEVH